MASPFAPVSAADDLSGLFEAEETMPRASLVSEDAARAKLVQWTFAVSPVLNLFSDDRRPSPSTERMRFPLDFFSLFIFAFFLRDGRLVPPFQPRSLPLPLFFRYMGSRERFLSLEISKRALERAQGCTASASFSRLFFSFFNSTIFPSKKRKKKLRSLACTASPRRPPPAPGFRPWC